MTNFKDYNRIMLIGNSGSGKSWFSRHIAEITGYPLIHLDNEYWLPEWTKTPKDEWVLKQNLLINNEKWIIDGNYNGTMELRFACADLVIFLDVNRFVCILSALKRTGKKRSDLPDYLDEPNPLSKEFIEFCRCIWSFPKTGRKTIIDLHTKYPEKDFWLIRSRRQIKKILHKKSP